MPRNIKHLVVVAAAFLAGLSLLSPPAAAISLEELSWQTFALNDLGGATVRFEARFVNNNEVASEPVTGELNPQPFGAFVGNAEGFICAFEIPSLQPLEEFTVICEIPLADLPPPADLQFPWKGSTYGCPADNFWAGGVEAFWTGDGGGVENVHRGTLLVCPRLENSYIRVIEECADGASWQFSGVCPGFTAQLVDDNFEAAPNPLPPGRFEGWICVDADLDVPIGTTCSFDLAMTCGDQTEQLLMSVQACDCLQAVGVEPSTWGAIKERLSR